MSLDSEIIEAVEKVLPAIQVDVLRNSLNELEAKRAETEDQRDHIERLQRDLFAVDESRALVEAETEKLSARIQGHNEKIVTLSNQGRDAEMASLRGRLEATEATMDRFLRNTIYREKLQHTVIQETPNIAYDPAGTHQVGVNRFPVPTENIKEQTTE